MSDDTKINLDVGQALKATAERVPWKVLSGPVVSALIIDIVLLIWVWGSYFVAVGHGQSTQAIVFMISGLLVLALNLVFITCYLWISVKHWRIFLTERD